MSQPQSQPQATENLINKPFEAVGYLRTEMIQTMEAVSRIADRGSSNLLLALGSGMFIMSFLFKLLPVRFWGQWLVSDGIRCSRHCVNDFALGWLGYASV
jgi:hypothetical protein